MSKRIGPLNSNLDRSKPATFNVTCSWCGAVIRKTNVELPEQMCLICHARMLNDYFQRVNKKSRGFTRINADKNLRSSA